MILDISAGSNFNICTCIPNLRCSQRIPSKRQNILPKFKTFRNFNKILDCPSLWAWSTIVWGFLPKIYFSPLWTWGSGSNSCSFDGLCSFSFFNLSIKNTFLYFNSPKPWRVLIPSFLLLSSFRLLPISPFNSLLPWPNLSFWLSFSLLLFYFIFEWNF